MAHCIKTSMAVAQIRSPILTKHNKKLSYGVSITISNEAHKGFHVLRQLRGLVPRSTADHHHHLLILKSSDTHQKKPSSQDSYHDNCFDLIAINHLTRTLQSITGNRTKRRGYEGLLDVARSMARSYDPKQQRSLAFLALQQAFPMFLLSPVRRVMAAYQSKFVRELLASFTTIFFAWLIGPSEVRESEIQGKKEKNKVHIDKCRFLEGSNCAGICINLCKYPTQMYIKSTLGIPVNMVPNFDDMSCEMIFGEEPPIEKEDPASRQPCYKICETRKGHNEKCS